MTTNTALLPLPTTAARATTTAGAALALIGTFLAWTYTDTFPGDLTVTGYPGGLQVLTLISAALTLLFVLSGYGIKGLRWLTPGGTNSPTRLLAIGTLLTTAYTVIAVILTKDDNENLLGVVELEPGAWVSLIGALVAAVAALGLPNDQPVDDTATGTFSRFLGSLRAPAPARAKALPAWAEILIIAVAFGVALEVFTYGIDTEYAELFIGYVIAVAFGFTALTRAGLIARVTALTSKHRNVTLCAALVAAFCFPFTQQNEEYALIGANILIFATVALGLNVVVGLAGLLDLGYVAFLGVGAYAAALVSGSPLSPVGVQFPFWAAVLTGAAVSSSSASSSAPRHSASAATTSPSSPSDSERSSASPSTPSTASAAPTSPTAPRASPASPTSSSSASTSDSATTSAASPSAGQPTTTC